MTKIAPSLLSADAANLGAELSRTIALGCDELHFDVMDGHFVPNITFGPHILKSLKSKYDIFYDVHLMVSNPLEVIPAYADAGANLITVHVEAEKPAESIQAIHEKGLPAGITLRPGTPLSAIRPYLDQVQRVLLMTVEPGFGGQKMIPEVLGKAREIRALGFRGEIEADGGINMENAETVARAGVGILVMGTAFYRSPNPEKAVELVHSL